MADDRTIAPGPSRWQRAWAAGLRPWSAWLWPAAGCGLAALLLHDGGSGAAAGWIDVRPGALTPSAWLGGVAVRLATLLLAAGVVVLGLAALSGRLGAVSTIDRQRLRPGPARSAGLVRLLLCVVVGMGVVLALDGALAGAARAVDASEAGLGALWLGWVERSAAALSLGLGLGAAVELWLDQRERGARLWQSQGQARDEARAAGGRAR